MHHYVSGCRWFSDMNISQGSVATRLTGGIFSCRFIGNLLLSAGKRILIIGQHLSKLLAEMYQAPDTTYAYKVLAITIVILQKYR